MIIVILISCVALVATGNQERSMKLSEQLRTSCTAQRKGMRDATRTIGPLSMVNAFCIHPAFHSPVSLQNEQYEVVELAPSEDAAERDSMVDNPRYGEIKH